MLATLADFFLSLSRQDIFQIAALFIGLIGLRMINTVHVLINSRMDQMLASSKREGAEEERERKKR